MKNYFLFPLLFFAFINLSAQSNKPVSIKKNEIGVHAGAVTGMGMSYRHWFGRYGFQITGIPIKTDNTEIYSASLTALYSFYENRYIRVFGYLGNHYFYDEEYGNNQPWKEISPNISIGDDDNSDNHYYDENSYYYKESYSVGFGPGFAFGKTVRFNVMVGYAFYDILDLFEMYPTAEFGVYYRF